MVSVTVSVFFGGGLGACLEWLELQNLVLGEAGGKGDGDVVLGVVEG